MYQISDKIFEYIRIILLFYLDWGKIICMKYGYFLKRILLIPVTLLGIIALNFAIVQMAPGGPVEQMMMKIDGTATAATARAFWKKLRKNFC